MLDRFLKYLFLPREITEFEARYLARMLHIALGFFWLHLPLMVGVAFSCETGVLSAIALTLLTLAGTTLAYRVLENPRHTCMAFGFAAMCFGGLLVHFGQGPMQIEMHFYFFVLIALLAVFSNPAVIITAAATAALHHLLLYFLLPKSVFNYEASIWTVVVHAVFVVLESIAACFVARSFFDNVIGLDKIVQQRTQQVEGRNRDMRLVLDNVNQGFVTLNLDGTMSKERSAILSVWLGGTGGADLTFWDYIRTLDEEASQMFRVGWDAIREGVFPLELLLDQMPRRMVVGARFLEIEYRPILKDEVLSKVLLVISDITSLIEREQSEAEQREMMCIFEKLLHNRTALFEFFKEADKIVQYLTMEQVRALSDVKRLVHTLKGNSGLLGLARIAQMCHQMETRMSEAGGDMSQRDRDELASAWRQLSEKIGRLVQKDDLQKIVIDEGEYAAILGGLSSGSPRHHLMRLIKSWKLQPTQNRLELCAEQLKNLAGRLGKGTLSVDIESNDLRLSPEYWAAFWAAFTHVLRNAVDHGLEAEEERSLLGKPQQPYVSLRTRLSEGQFLLEITDDGRGIDWDRVAEKARAHGLPSTTEEELVEALFTDGLSTRDDVTEYSGRGVGLAAIREVCRQMSGQVRVVSKRGSGTTFQFRFPLHVMSGEHLAPGETLPKFSSVPPRAAMPA